jgi:methylmalonyl-CoA mutase
MATQPTSPKPELHVPVNPVRIVTASALFDGHDASINIMRRIMQSQGAEVIHLGHNRSVQEVVDAAVEEDVQGVAVSSYQGGHVEYFEYLVQLLAEAGAGHVQVVGGGGGVIVPEEIERLRAAGVTIFSPQDGQRLGLPGMVNQVIAACDVDLDAVSPPSVPAVLTGERAAVARAITAAERPATSPVRCAPNSSGRHPAAGPRSSASPARAGRASRASPTSSCAACAWTSRTSCASRASPSTRPAAAVGEPAR